MHLSDLQPGDVVYAATALYNDGGLHGVAAEALLAAPGTRGVIINIGRLEEDPGATIFLVRFEDAQKSLGPPVGCLPEELTARPPTAP